MLEVTFQNQMKRLQSRWPRVYEQELTALFWRAFKDVSDAFFVAGIDDCIGTLRSAPMFPELDEAVQRARSRYLETQMRGHHDLPEVVYNAQRMNQKADPEFVEMCVKLLKDRIANAISKEHFQEGLSILERASKEK